MLSQINRRVPFKILLPFFKWEDINSDSNLIGNMWLLFINMLKLMRKKSIPLWDNNKKFLLGLGWHLKVAKTILSSGVGIRTSQKGWCDGETHSEAGRQCLPSSAPACGLVRHLNLSGPGISLLQNQEVDLHKLKHHFQLNPSRWHYYST